MRLNEGKKESVYVNKLNSLRNQCEAEIKDISKEKNKLIKQHKKEVKTIADINEKYE